MSEKILEKNHYIRIGHLDVDGRMHPIGMDQRKPVFHYTAAAEGLGRGVTFLQIVVKNAQGIYWDSSRIAAGTFPYVTYAGPPLMPKTEYRVSLRVWDEEGTVGPFCKEISFETGVLEDGFFAEWLEPEQQNAILEEEIPFFRVFHPSPDYFGGHVRCRPAQNIRKVIRLEKSLKKARIYATAHGIYELYVNGKKAGQAYLAPEISSYQKYLYYQTYDVTGLLSMEENIIAVTLSDGWWTGRIGLIGSSCQYGDRLGLLFQMELEYEDGTRDIICGDESFLSHESEIRYADLYIGEMCDKTMEQQGWMEPGFEAKDWKSCKPASYAKDNLIGQPTDGIVDYQYFIPERWIQTPAGECVVDFGQVIAGVAELTIDAKAGQKIVLEYCENLDENGNYFRNIVGRNKDQRDVLCCKEGVQHWRPRFTYHGFRYVRISGADKQDIRTIRAAAIYSEMVQTGQFECSDENINQLQHNILWSQRTNMIAIPTDCPQREKMGWTGDIQIFAKTGSFNYELRCFLKAWLANLRAEQKEDGGIPVVIPNFPRQEEMQRQIGRGSVTSSGWSDACILLPWYLYMAYGDISFLTENLECMKRYLVYVKTEAAGIPEHYNQMTEAQKARNPYLWNKGYHYGDWLIPSLQKLPDGINRGRTKTRTVVGSCWYAITVAFYVEICRELQKVTGLELKEEIEEKEALLKKIRTAIRAEYVQDDGTVGDGSLQGVYVMVLRSGAVDGDLKKKTAGKLAGLIHKNGGCLDTGFSSVGFLMEVLCENGYRELARQLLYQTKSPSWLYMVERGATTIWENWEAVRPDGTVTESSFNHYAFGCIGDWIYQNIGGIMPGAPGYKHIIFAPDIFCGMNHADCSLITPFGRAHCGFKIAEDDCFIRVEVPIGTTAELHYGGVVIRLVSGKYHYHFKVPKKN